MPRRRVIEDSSDEETNDGSSNNTPSDESLEQGLRDAVANIFRKGNLQELTVKRVRLATESALGLEEGFFKGHDTWKARSDQIIKEEAEAQEEQKSQAQDETAPKNPAPVASSKTSNRKPKKPVKRDSEEVVSNKKKRRKVDSDIELEEAISPSEQDGEEKSTKKSPKSTPKATVAQKQAADESENEEPPKPLDEETVADKGEQSESEMSIVLDEEPKPKPKKRQKGAQAVPKAPKTKAPSKADGDVDPDQAEIKRLQGWLIKCGIRKMWHRELAACETPKAKIKHLKKMLEDAGMKGRYSIEKARQIRDERELRADLEAVKEGASKWGASGVVDGGDSEQDKPRRRLVKGRQSLAFLSDDGEETD